HAAETTDPTLVYCPEENTLVAGDTVMTGSFPIFGQPVQQEGLEDDSWLSALDQVRSFGADHVLPGHGPVAHIPELKILEDICRYFLDHTHNEFAAGHDIHTAIKNIEAHLPTWITVIPVVWGTPRYAILRAWAGLAQLSEPGWQHIKPSACPTNDPAAAEKIKNIAHRQQSENWLDAADQCVEGGDIGQCISLLHLATKELPGNHLIWTKLGERLIEASRGIPSVLEKGDCFFEARSCWEKALEIEPQYAPALLADATFLCMMAFRNGDVPDIGLARMDQAEAAGADAAAVNFYRGIAARSMGDETSAKSHFTQALEHNPGFMQARLAMMA
ncbi:MAG: hypothetical protein HRU15_05850, partial [Planctomycetes bacterium]|nr:hypothetical protein [Planctomycetota bacterium]